MKSVFCIAFATLLGHGAAVVLPTLTLPALPNIASSVAALVNTIDDALLTASHKRPCQNGPKSRGCWGQYSIDTDWYVDGPTTGKTREYWLNVQNTTLAPDGYERYTLNFNGTIPGPAIIADWGDNIVVHVTNKLQNNGTAIHWHGIRQLGSLEYDGVPGVTQCPISPSDTLTYRFKANQYGTTWYHSHFTLQYGDGLLGPLIINGPATADYDEDLGTVFLSDWFHSSVFQLWDIAKLGRPPQAENGLINGTNTFNCAGSTDPKCKGTGKKLEINFTKGKKYRIRLVNTATDGHFQFSIDGHSFTVMANDLVPIKPYKTSSLHVSIGQRYDIVVEANADAKDYWLRAGWQNNCSGNKNPNDITAIVRYKKKSKATPTTTGITPDTNCGDEPASSLIPYLVQNVTAPDGTDLTAQNLSFAFNQYFQWTINSSSLYLNWSNPTTLQIYNGDKIFPTNNNVVSISKQSSTDIWSVYVINDVSGIPLTHPIHLHGHDFYVLAQGLSGTFNPKTSPLSLINPPRRDVASLPGGGYLVIAFKKDNPGSWLLHCHIAWHASEGLAMQFVESQDQIKPNMHDTAVFKQTCKNWNAFTPGEVYSQEDSGI